jgi:hypothetical protein
MKLQTVDCLPCSANFHYECNDLKLEEDELYCCCEGLDKTPVATEGRAYKEDEDVTDPKSTGRKRAAQLYPLPKEGEDKLECEWRYLKFAGGGVYPIIGCIVGFASHRHHGPDKNTLNNSMGNVHRICHHCHNRWHTLNDAIYSSKFGSADWKQHDAETRATTQEQITNEAKWITAPAERPKED